MAFAKTTLVASYLAARRQRVLWYQADEGDADVATFFYYLGLAAPRRRRPLPLLTTEYRHDVAVLTRGFFRELYGRYQRVSASPTMAAWLWQALLEIDVRGVLGSIRAPTLLLGRQGDRMAPVDGVAALAAAIPGAEFNSLAQGPHGLLDDTLGSAILDFVTGGPSVVVDERADGCRHGGSGRR